MRKHVLALLSMLGLASSSTPASAQVVKGAQPSDTKSESTIKKSKLSQEDAASKDAAKAKWKAQSVEGGQATSDASAAKMRKAGGDPNLQGSRIDKDQKAKAELKATQGAREYKEQKATLGDGSVRPATGTTAHGGGSGSGKVAQRDILVKTKKNASELNTVQQDAAKKQRKQVDQASPK